MNHGQPHDGAHDNSPHIANMRLGDDYNIGSKTLRQPAEVLEISAIGYHDDGPFVAEPKRSIRFAELPDGRLILNRTNKDRLIALYGLDGAAWIGRRVLVYRTRTTYAGRPENGIRVWHPREIPPDMVIDENGQPVTVTPPPPHAPEP